MKQINLHIYRNLLYGRCGIADPWGKNDFLGAVPGAIRYPC